MWSILFQLWKIYSVFCSWVEMELTPPLQKEQSHLPPSLMSLSPLFHCSPNYTYQRTVRKYIDKPLRRDGEKVRERRRELMKAKGGGQSLELLHRRSVIKFENELVGRGRSERFTLWGSGGRQGPQSVAAPAAPIMSICLYSEAGEGKRGISSWKRERMLEHGGPAEAERRREINVSVW